VALRGSCHTTSNVKEEGRLSMAVRKEAGGRAGQVPAVWLKKAAWAARAGEAGRGRRNERGRRKHTKLTLSFGAARFFQAQAGTRRGAARCREQVSEGCVHWGGPLGIGAALGAGEWRK